MDNRRQAFAREPIEIDFGGGVIVSVGPVPWEQRNDFGNEVMRQHVEILNEAVQIYVQTDAEDAIPQLQAKFAEKFTDPDALFKLGLDEATYQQVHELHLFNNQIVAVMLAICDVNEMSQLHPLLDPNSLAPTTLGGIVSGMLGEEDTLRTASGADSSSQDLSEAPSGDSPTLS
jgi:hypothetical protein